MTADKKKLSTQNKLSPYFSPSNTQTFSSKANAIYIVSRWILYGGLSNFPADVGGSFFHPLRIPPLLPLAI